MSRFKRTYALLTLMTGAALLAGGCGETVMTPTGPPPVSLLAMGNRADAEAWRSTWPGSADRFGEGGPAEMSILGAAAPSGTPDVLCFMVRVLLLDGDYAPLRTDGTLRVLLLARRDGAYETVGGWRFSPMEFEQAYREGLLPGYLFDLRWVDVGGTSVYRLIFRWDSRDGKTTLTKPVIFVNTVRSSEAARDDVHDFKQSQ